MPGSGGAVGRRAVLRALGLLGALAALPAGAAGCAPAFTDTRLALATGAMEGGYFALGTALARAWQRELRLRDQPEVLSTKGSLENLQLLEAGTTNLIFCQVDVAAARADCCSPTDPRSPRALARIYDDVVHVVTPADSPIRTLAQLRGARVSVGDPESGVYFVTQRLLAAAGVEPARDLRSVQLGIAESAHALAAGEIDAFFWSGSVPTQGIETLAGQLPIRLVDLSDVVGAVRDRHPEYAPGIVPAGTYGMQQPVTSLLVRNVLLVQASMPDELAEALVVVLFAAQPELTRASRAALTIDPRAAIGTQPLLLHAGAERFYRSKIAY